MDGRVRAGIPTDQGGGVTECACFLSFFFLFFFFFRFKKAVKKKNQSLVEGLV